MPSYHSNSPVSRKRNTPPSPESPPSTPDEPSQPRAIKRIKLSGPVTIQYFETSNSRPGPTPNLQYVTPQPNTPSSSPPQFPEQQSSPPSSLPPPPLSPPHYSPQEYPSPSFSSSSSSSSLSDPHSREYFTLFVGRLSCEPLSSSSDIDSDLEEMRQACVIQDPINEHQGWLLQRVGEEPDPYLFREWRWHLDLQRKKWACGRMPDQYDELVAQVLRPGHAVLAPSPLRKSWGAEE